MSDYVCRKCPYKKLCKEIGLDDLSCEDIANIAKAGEPQTEREGE